MKRSVRLTTHSKRRTHDVAQEEQETNKEVGIRCFLLDAIHHPHEHALRGVKLHVRISRPHR